MAEKLYTVPEVAKKQGVSRPLVYKWIKDKRDPLKTIRGMKGEQGGREMDLIRESDLNDFLKRRKQGIIIENKKNTP